jgi:hypothetical protein
VAPRPSIPLAAPQRQDTSTPTELYIPPHLTAKANELVRVTLLGASEINTCGWLVGASNRGLDLLVEQAIALGQPLKVELGQHVWLGEVHALVPLAGVYRVSFAVEHFINTGALPPWWRSLQRPGDSASAGIEGRQTRRS